MIEIDDLWIGDLLLLKKSGRIGKFNGRKGHKKVKVKIGDKTVITPISNIEFAPEDAAIKEIVHSHRPKITPKPVTTFSDIIDLHIEALDPSLHSNRAERIVDIQIKAAKTFIDTSISNRTKRILIIHGKGEGVLKSEVSHLLSLYDEVQFTFEQNAGGATEVWFY